MLKRKQNIALVCVFMTALMFIPLLFLLIPDRDVSYTERRRLARMPELTAETVFSGEYMSDAEKYLLDQFPFRDAFRTLKAFVRLRVFGQRDNNGVYIVGDRVFKTEYPLNEEQVVYAAEKIALLTAKHMSGMNVYYSVIPDKNYFSAARNGYPALDYGRMSELMRANCGDAKYIDITGSLSEDSYYRTDTHWRQEAISGTADLLLAGMGNPYRASADVFEEKTLAPFYGVYSGQAALPVKPDALTYLTNPMLESCTVTSVESEGKTPVYTTERFSGMDGYDVFLSGAAALLTVENPSVTTGRELIIFRDSFGSSLAPLLIGGYSKVTLVDLRYVSSQLLTEYIEFKDQDVLFIYSTLILNSGMLLR